MKATRINTTLGPHLDLAREFFGINSMAANYIEELITEYPLGREEPVVTDDWGFAVWMEAMNRTGSVRQEAWLVAGPASEETLLNLHTTMTKAGGFIIPAWEEINASDH